MVLRFALKVGGIPSPVEVSGPQWWIIHPFQGIPLVQRVPLVPLLHLFPVVRSYPSGLYVLVVPYGHLQHFPLQKDHLGPLGDPLHCPFHFLCYYPTPMILPYWLKPGYWRLLIQHCWTVSIIMGITPTKGTHHFFCCYHRL